jgi:hypothetical protein
LGDKFRPLIGKRGGLEWAKRLTGKRRREIAIKASRAAAKARTRKARERKGGHSMKSAMIFIVFGLLAGVIQRIINTLVGMESPAGLKGVVWDFPTYTLGVLVGYYVLKP